ncbi:MAG: YggT family protein [Clostridia bacterium]|nr:YggT family protein [Clostridia bacterium]
MTYLIIKVINLLANIILLMLGARAVASWFMSGGSPNVYRFYNTMCSLTEPIVAPCRRFCSRWNTGMFDFSVLLAFLLVQVIRSILIKLIVMLTYTGI